MIETPSVELQKYFNLEESSRDRHSFNTVSYDDVQEIVNADTKKKVNILVAKYLPASSVNPGDKPFTVNDFELIRTMLLNAFDLNLLKKRENVTRDDLEACSVDVAHFSRHDKNEDGKSIADAQAIISAFLPNAVKDAGGPFSARRFIELGDNLFSGNYSILLQAEEESPYIDFLKDGIKSAKESGYSCSLFGEENMWFLEVSTSFNEATERGYRFSGELVLDALFAIHLHDISTLTKNGVLYQQSKSFISSLWYCLAESFRGGRAGKCKVCGKPFIAFDERGKQRLYCLPACNKKHQRLERFKKLVEQGHNPKEAAKQAGIRKSDGEAYLKKTNTTQ